jgi:biopolymer transport protein ExbD
MLMELKIKLFLIAFGILTAGAYADGGSPKQKVVSLSLRGIHHKSIDPLADNVVTIMVAHSGEILVNGAALKEPSKLKAALESRIAKRPVEEVSFVLYFDDDSNGAFASDVLSVLTELGVESVDLIDL